MNPILVEVWDAFKASSEKIFKNIFLKTNLLPLIPPEFDTDNQSCVAFVQVYFWYKDDNINGISHHTIVPVEVQELRSYDPMVVFLSKGIEQVFRNIFLQASVYDNAKKQTIIPLQ